MKLFKLEIKVKADFVPISLAASVGSLVCLKGENKANTTTPFKAGKVEAETISEFVVSFSNLSNRKVKVAKQKVQRVIKRYKVFVSYNNNLLFKI